MDLGPVQYGIVRVSVSGPASQNLEHLYKTIK